MRPGVFSTVERSESEDDFVSRLLRGAPECVRNDATIYGMDSLLMALLRLFMTLSGLLLLSACADPLEPFRPSPDQLRRASWYPPSGQSELEPRYCYRTRGRADCHTTPSSGDESRRVGSFHAPADP